ncbi:hypothetical protein AQUCO_07400095v1 [Aquilegia coerulea]|uniref:Uncharacterized protein n=1 Tax=Aquilegia coerulea TaxID=218851 RepID=A0A2G5C9S5_AQUCA|nr:hypothetical protein AQUCO_07400095v1 [Aquilegia coerulea]
MGRDEDRFSKIVIKLRNNLITIFPSNSNDNGTNQSSRHGWAGTFLYLKHLHQNVVHYTRHVKLRLVRRFKLCVIFP